MIGVLGVATAACNPTVCGLRPGPVGVIGPGVRSEGGEGTETGGGVVIRPANRERLKANGTVIYLHAMPELLRERTRRSRHRPLLNAADPIARLAELYAARDALYREVASMIIESNREEISQFSRRLEAALHDSPQA